LNAKGMPRQMRFQCDHNMLGRLLLTRDYIRDNVVIMTKGCANGGKVHAAAKAQFHRGAHDRGQISHQGPGQIATVAFGHRFQRRGGFPPYRRQILSSLQATPTPALVFTQMQCSTQRDLAEPSADAAIACACCELPVALGQRQPALLQGIFGQVIVTKHSSQPCP
jgi:hypothetical protein